MVVVSTEGGGQVGERRVRRLVGGIQPAKIPAACLRLMAGIS